MEYNTFSAPRNAIIIGGGFAGIAAAAHLARNGCRVTVIERSGYLGGRARSFTDSVTGEEIDNGQHVLMGCYSATLQLLQHWHGTSSLQGQPTLQVHYAQKGGKRTVLRASALPFGAGLALGIARLGHLSWHERLAALRLGLALQTGLLAPLPTESALDFLQRTRQPKNVITGLWEPIILATLNASVKEASAELLTTVLKIAFFGSTDSSRILIASEGLSALTAGFPAWLEQHGGRLLLSTSAEEILVAEGNTHVRGVRLASGEVLTADIVISAVGNRAATTLLPEQSLPMRTSPIVSLYLWFDTPFPNIPFAALLGTTTQWLFNRRLLANAPEDIVQRFPGHLALTISAADSLAERSADTIIKECCAEVMECFPAFSKANLLHAKVIKERLATPLLTPDTNSLRPNCTTATSGLFIAGDWTATGLPATIEGAVRSGEAAATAALQSKL